MREPISRPFRLIPAHADNPPRGIVEDVGMGLEVFFDFLIDVWDLHLEEILQECKAQTLDRGAGLER